MTVTLSPVAGDRADALPVAPGVPARVGGETPAAPRALVFEATGRPELSVELLERLRRDAFFDEVPVLLAIQVERLAEVSPTDGFDDFMLYPYLPEELHRRVRTLEWRKVAPRGAKLGSVVLDRAAREVRVDGGSVRLTSKEFALLSYLWTRPGCVVTREQLLAGAWEDNYSGGVRTIDIHIRRLRAKLGRSVIETVRGAGYKLPVRSAEAQRSDRVPVEPREP